MIPKIIHQVWIGDRVPQRFQNFSKTIRMINPEFRYILWTRANVRDVMLNINAVEPAANSAASLSNGIRILALRKFGGVYLDMDIECLKPISTLVDGATAFAAVQDNKDGVDRLCNAVFGSSPYHPWLMHQAIDGKVYDLINSTADYGVDLMSEAPRDELTVIPTHLVYPWLWTDPPEKRVPHKESILVHHWDGSWVNKNT